MNTYTLIPKETEVVKRTPFIWLFMTLVITTLLAACAAPATGQPTQEAAMTDAPVVEPTEAMTEMPMEVPTEAKTEASVEPTQEPVMVESILPEVNPAEFTGGIITAGSSTVFPLSERMAQLWEDEGGPTVTVDSIGSGAGFERFCVNAETDIANASRPIKEEEIT